jgi:ribosomal protein L37AE/L43A
MKKDNNNRPNQGWKLEDQWYLNKYDNAQADPDVQILTDDQLEDENKEHREYWCAICKSRLDYVKNLDMWYCSACVQHYDTNIQDVPLNNIKDSKVRMQS